MRIFLEIFDYSAFHLNFLYSPTKSTPNSRPMAIAARIAPLRNHRISRRPCLRLSIPHTLSSGSPVISRGAKVCLSSQRTPNGPIGEYRNINSNHHLFFLMTLLLFFYIHWVLLATRVWKFWEIWVFERRKYWETVFFQLKFFLLLKKIFEKWNFRKNVSEFCKFRFFFQK